MAMNMMLIDVLTNIHCVKYRKFARNYAFPQNFHTRKLGEITVFFAVISATYTFSA